MKKIILSLIVCLVTTGAFAKNIADITAKENSSGYLVRGNLKIDAVVVCTLPENLVVDHSNKSFECNGHQSSVGISFSQIGDDTFKNVVFQVTLPSQHEPAVFSYNVDHWHNVSGRK